MTKISGWFAILLAILSLAPSVIPGAISIMGLLISLIALFISLYSVIDSGKKYFYVTLLISTLGLIALNDTTRLWNPLAPTEIRITIYGIFTLVVLVFMLIAHHFAKPDSDVQT